MEYFSTPSSCHSEERSDVGISGDGNPKRVWVSHSFVIARSNDCCDVAI